MGTPVTITYLARGIEPPIFVCGSLSHPQWAPMEMDSEQDAEGTRVFSFTFHVAPGNYQYKLRHGIGDWWVCDESVPTIDDGAGNRNNHVVVDAALGAPLLIGNGSKAYEKLAGSKKSSSSQIHVDSIQDTEHGLHSTNSPIIVKETEQHSADRVSPEFSLEAGENRQLQASPNGPSAQEVMTALNAESTQRPVSPPDSKPNAIPLLTCLPNTPSNTVLLAEETLPTVNDVEEIVAGESPQQDTHNAADDDSQVNPIICVAGREFHPIGPEVPTIPTIEFSDQEVVADERAQLQEEVEDLAQRAIAQEELAVAAKRDHPSKPHHHHHRRHPRGAGDAVPKSTISDLFVSPRSR